MIMMCNRKAVWFLTMLLFFVLGLGEGRGSEAQSAERKAQSAEGRVLITTLNWQGFEVIF